MSLIMTYLNYTQVQAARPGYGRTGPLSRESGIENHGHTGHRVHVSFAGISGNLLCCFYWIVFSRDRGGLYPGRYPDQAGDQAKLPCHRTFQVFFRRGQKGTD